MAERTARVTPAVTETADSAGHLAGIRREQAARERTRARRSAARPEASRREETGQTAAAAGHHWGLGTRLTPAVTARLAADLAWGMTGAVYIGCASFVAGGRFNPRAAAAVMAVTAAVVLAATGAVWVPGWLRGACSRAWLRMAGAPLSSVAADADARAAGFLRWLRRNAKRLVFAAGLLIGWGIAGSWRLSSWLPPPQAGSVVWVLAVLAAPFCLVSFPLWRVLALRALGALRSADAGFAAGCAIALAMAVFPFGVLGWWLAGPRVLGDWMARALFWILPAALTAGTGGWLSLLLYRKVRTSASRWLAHAGDVLFALVLSSRTSRRPAVRRRATMPRAPRLTSPGGSRSCRHPPSLSPGRRNPQSASPGLVTELACGNVPIRWQRPCKRNKPRRRLWIKWGSSPPRP
jgi:hypothetical protein